MAKKINTNSYNPLLIPFVITLVAFAFFIGLSIKKSDPMQLESYDIQISPIPTITIEVSPTKTYNIIHPTSVQNTFKMYTLPLSGKSVNCQQNHYDEIVTIGNQILQIKNTINQLGSDGIKCVETRCKDSSTDFSNQCKNDPNQTDFETCLYNKFEVCANECNAPMNSYKKINEQSNSNIENQFNTLIKRYCQN